MLSCGSTPKPRATRRRVAGDEQVGALRQHVGDHQRVELRGAALARHAHRLEQLVLAVEQRLADDLDLRDADLLPQATWYCLASRETISSALTLRDVGGGLEHLAAELAGVDREHALEVLDDRVVALGRRRRS